MEEPGSDPGSYPIPPAAASVHLSPFSSLAPPRLHFTRRRTQPLQSSPRYSSLKSLLDDPSGPALSIGRDETLAWELFTPHQRLMLVAVIGAAAADSKKNGVIRQLQKSIDLRDQALTGMQQKLDDLCQQLSLVKVSGHGDDLESKFGSENFKFVECGCLLCDQHHHSSPAVQDKSSTNVVVEAEQEERRLSYLSDWCSSVTSAAELHFDNLSLDQDMLSLRKECQEKDATIKDLTSFLQLTNKACSKRETELEEIVRRKKTIIKKLKRDVLVLEEKVTQLTRLQRPSYSAAASNTCEFPMRVDNLLYDMDVSTASSSSDSDTPANTPLRTLLEEDAPVDSIKEEPSALERTNKSTASLVKSVKPSSIVSPMTTTRKPVSVSSSASSSRMRGASSSAGDSKKPRRPVQVAPRASSSGSHKRWV